MFINKEYLETKFAEKKRRVDFVSKDAYLCAMLEIEKHIENLLLEHDCVIVPELGGFVVRVKPAGCRAGTYSFEPARKEIVFNETLRHNDGLLIESYMQKERVDYNQARRLVADDVAALRAALREQGTCPLGHAGTLSLGEEERLVFLAGDAEWLNRAAFGLPPFVFEPLSVRFPSAVPAAGGKPREKEVYYIPVSRRFLHAVAASAAGVALLLSVSTPVKDVDRAAYSASFVPAEMIPSPAWENAGVSPAAATTGAPETAAAETAGKTEAAHAGGKEKEGAAAAPKAGGKHYYVVIASFLTASQAGTYLKEVDRQLFRQADVVRYGENYRVYADCFTERETAEAYMENLRKDGRYKDAWLFISR